MIDLQLLDPAMTEEQLAAQCEKAYEYGIASVTVRPVDVHMAAKWVGPDVVCGSVVGPELTTATKLYAIRDLLQRGAREFTFGLSVSKMASRQFKYLETEFIQLVEQVRGGQQAASRLVLELETQAQDLQVIACKLARRCSFDFARASSRVTPADEGLKWLQVRLGDAVRMDAGGDVRTLAEAKRLYRGGCPRFASRDPWGLLKEWRAELAAVAATAEKAKAAEAAALPPSQNSTE